MKEHHTKEKGDLGVSAIIFDLRKAGINVCLPMSEHLPFDLVAVSSNGLLKRVSVKYRHFRKETGAIDFMLRSCWADKNGTHTVLHTKNEYDCLAFYCPDNGECYYVPVCEIRGQSVNIRVLPNKRKIQTGLQAHELKDPNRIFGLVARID